MFPDPALCASEDEQRQLWEAAAQADPQTTEDQSGSIFWHTFNTECWEGGLGTEYPGGSSLESIMVLVPGDLAARSFDFCIYELGVL